ncbi:aminotransferase class V-fold PLP-dependent enzyme [Mycoplasmopsis iners]|uniref:aminotransferase class V-fold PLP-dependent enzyme n=1 Tax=Mycoplasmopsis iners TaxID=76630 RepID=UPI0004980D72|nr:aminotransferase class V-fold PLP-dependent enzyme [Mycoplasmopsis iners]
MNSIRTFFPLLEKITFLDNSAMAQKPTDALEAEMDFYTKYAVSTRTSETEIGIKNLMAINELKAKVKDLLLAQNEHIVFTSGTTDSLNKIALMLKDNIKSGDKIVLSAYNHSSNIGPWIKIANEQGATIIFSEDIVSALDEKVKIIALSQITNSFDQQIDLNNIYQKANEIGALVINDAAQAIISEQVSFANCDVIAFSANKLYGPTGFGILAFNEKINKLIKPVFIGGGTVDRISLDCSLELKNSDAIFEPGTPNLAAIHMFNKSLDWFNKNVGYAKTKEILLDLTHYLWDKLAELPNVTLYNNRDNHIILFNINNVPAQDVAHYLGTQNIYVRSGIFCAKYLSNIKPEGSYIRASLGIYNNKADCDRLIEALKEGGDFLVI